MTESRSGTCFNYVPTTLRAQVLKQCTTSSNKLPPPEHCVSTAPDIDVQHGKGELVTQGGGKCLETVMSSWHSTINGTIWDTLNLTTLGTSFYDNRGKLSGNYFLPGRFAEFPLSKHSCRWNPWDRDPNIASLKVSTPKLPTRTLVVQLYIFVCCMFCILNKSACWF